jgi:hypothetical protein
MEHRMSRSFERLAAHLHALEAELARDLEEQQHRWRYRLGAGRVRFDEEVRVAHTRLRQSLPAYIREGSLRSLVTAPVIYSLIAPLALLDLWVFTYQWICFPIYGIARVPRPAFFVFDRRKLAYLNGIEKINCTFCSYANGLIAYVREVAARTEQYWCPIKHAHPVAGPHARYHFFFDYGDADSYHDNLMPLRGALRPVPPDRPDTGTHGGDADRT